jgi:hypothetical protein
MRSQQYLMPVRFDRTRYAIQSAKRALLVAAVVAVAVQFDLSPVLHGAAAHHDEAPGGASFKRMPALEFTGSVGAGGVGRGLPPNEPESKHRMGYLEFED